MDFAFQPDFQQALIFCIREAMQTALDMQARIYDAGFIKRKEDRSPVTEADHAVQKMVQTFLAQYADISFVGEESDHSGGHPGEVFWLCDPIDGTRQYAKGERDFCINLALIHNQKPVFGLIGAPAWGEIAMLDTDKKVVIINGTGEISYPAHETIDEQNHGQLIIGRGRVRDVAAFEDRFGFPPAQVIERSSALKFFNLLRGEADYYIRAGEVSEWDVAAGQALLEAAGGTLCPLDGIAPISYGNVHENYLLQGVYAVRTRNGL